MEVGRISRFFILKAKTDLRRLLVEIWLLEVILMSANCSEVSCKESLYYLREYIYCYKENAD
jgi:hypothetical protein